MFSSRVRLLWVGVWSLVLLGCSAKDLSGSAQPASMNASASSAVPVCTPTPSTLVSSAPSAVVEKPPSSPVKLAFVGDIALNYSIAKDLEKLAAGDPPKDMEPGFPFAGVKERLSAADVAVGNLECVVSAKGTLSTWHKPFRSPIIGIDVIKSAGIDAVSVANNHSWDFGADGFYDMLQNLDAKNLPVLGRGYKQELAHEPEKPWKVEIRGTKVAFLGFYLETDDALKRDVEAAKKEADVVVAYFHWGREKQSEATPEQKRQARVVIDAGGDLVVGSHVHVLQPTEMYKGKLIAYGLGNFVFMGMNTEERFRRGAILEVELSKEALIGFELVSTRVDDKGAPRIVVPENSYLPDAPKTSKP